MTRDIKEMQRLLEQAILNILGNDYEKWKQVVEENKKLEDEVKKKLKEKLGGS